MEFSNPSIASRFAIVGSDRHILIAGKYNGLLSDVDDEDILNGMIQRKSNLVALKNGGGSGVVNSGAMYQFEGAAGQSVFPLPVDPQAAIIHEALKSTKMLVVAVEGSVLGRGNGLDQYQYDSASGTITFNQPITKLKTQINFFK